MPAGAHSADDAVASAASMKYTKLSMQLTHRECNNMLTKQLMKQRLPAAAAAAAAAAAKFIGHCQPLWQVLKKKLHLEDFDSKFGPRKKNLKLAW